MENSLDETELKIIEATLKTLSENGLSSTTTVKIAENAEVNEVTIFRRFKSKNNLLKIANNYYLNYLLNEIDNVFKYDKDKKLEVLLKDIWWAIQNFFEKNIVVLKAAFDGFHTMNENKIIDIASNKIIKNLTDIFENAVANNQIRNINPRMAAFTIFNMIFQTTIHWRIYRGEAIPNVEENINHFLDIFFNGVVN